MFIKSHLEEKLICTVALIHQLILICMLIYKEYIAAEKPLISAFFTTNTNSLGIKALILTACFIFQIIFFLYSSIKEDEIIYKTCGAILTIISAFLSISTFALSLNTSNTNTFGLVSYFMNFNFKEKLTFHLYHGIFEVFFLIVACFILNNYPKHISTLYGLVLLDIIVSMLILPIFGASWFYLIFFILVKILYYKVCVIRKRSWFYSALAVINLGLFLNFLYLGHLLDHINNQITVSYLVGWVKYASSYFSK